METKQIQSFLKGKLETVDYSLLQKYHSMIGDELKRRDSSLLIVTTPTGNYNKTL